MCGEIHTGSSKSKGPAFDGLWLTLIKEATPATLVNCVGRSRNKGLGNTVIKKKA